MPAGAMPTEAVLRIIAVTHQIDPRMASSSNETKLFGTSAFRVTPLSSSGALHGTAAGGIADTPESLRHRRDDPNRTLRAAAVKISYSRVRRDLAWRHPDGD